MVGKWRYIKNAANAEVLQVALDADFTYWRKESLTGKPEQIFTVEIQKDKTTLYIYSDELDGFIEALEKAKVDGYIAFNKALAKATGQVD